MLKWHDKLLAFICGASVTFLVCFNVMLCFGLLLTKDASDAPAWEPRKMLCRTWPAHRGFREKVECIPAPERAR